MSIAEIIVRDKETICEMILVTVNLVVNNNAVPYFTIATGAYEKVQIFYFVTFLVRRALLPA
jgi:hypothetical protein